MKLKVGGHSVASMETRELRAQHTDALKALREHRGRCIRCEQAVRRRTGRHCPEGAELLQAEHDLKAKIKESVALDAAPIPGQETLFSEDECRP